MEYEFLTDRPLIQALFSDKSSIFARPPLAYISSFNFTVKVFDYELTRSITANMADNIFIRQAVS